MKLPNRPDLIDLSVLLAEKDKCLQLGSIAAAKAVVGKTLLADNFGVNNLCR